MDPLLEVLRSGRLMVSDGAWGTMLHSAGLPPGQCPELWNIENPSPVRSIASEYAAAGADALCIETMSATDEAELAIRAAKETTALPVVCTFTFDAIAGGGYRTMMGVAPADAARAARAAGADILGTNCGNGLSGMVEIIREIRAALPDVPLLVHANAGRPRRVGDHDEFPETPSDMATQVKGLLDAGCSVIGGCCGTTPGHIRAIREAMDACFPGLQR